MAKKESLTRYFVKYKGGVPMHTFTVENDDRPLRPIHKAMVEVLLSEGYMETDFITEHNAWDSILKSVDHGSSDPRSWKAQGDEFKRRRLAVNGLTYDELHARAIALLKKRKEEAA